jgi:hypothetical protein
MFAPNPAKAQTRADHIEDQRSKATAAHLRAVAGKVNHSRYCD